MTRWLAEAVVENTPPLALYCSLRLLPDAARSHPEIRRLLDEMNAP